MASQRKLGINVILAMILGLVGVQILLSVATDIIPTSAESYYDLTQAMTNTTVFGTAPVSFIGNTVAYVGWFWALLPFLLIVGVIFGLYRMTGMGGRK